MERRLHERRCACAAALRRAGFLLLQLPFSWHEVVIVIVVHWERNRCRLGCLSSTRAFLLAVAGVAGAGAVTVAGVAGAQPWFSLALDCRLHLRLRLRLRLCLRLRLRLRLRLHLLLHVRLPVLPRGEVEVPQATVDGLEKFLGGNGIPTQFAVVGEEALDDIVGGDLLAGVEVALEAVLVR